MSILTWWNVQVRWQIEGEDAEPRTQVCEGLIMMNMYIAYRDLIDSWNWELMTRMMSMAEVSIIESNFWGKGDEWFVVVGSDSHSPRFCHKRSWYKNANQVGLMTCDTHMLVRYLSSQLASQPILQVLDPMSNAAQMLRYGTTTTLGEKSCHCRYDESEGFDAEEADIQILSPSECSLLRTWPVKPENRQLWEYAHMPGRTDTKACSYWKSYSHCVTKLAAFCTSLSLAWLLEALCYTQQWAFGTYLHRSIYEQHHSSWQAFADQNFSYCRISTACQQPRWDLKLEAGRSWLHRVWDWGRECWGCCHVPKRSHRGAAGNGKVYYFIITLFKQMASMAANESPLILWCLTLLQLSTSQFDCLTVRRRPFQEDLLYELWSARPHTSDTPFLALLSDRQRHASDDGIQALTAEFLSNVCINTGHCWRVPHVGWRAEQWKRQQCRSWMKTSSLPNKWRCWRASGILQTTSKAISSSLFVATRITSSQQKTYRLLPRVLAGGRASAIPHNIMISILSGIAI